MALVYEKICQEDISVGTGAINVTAPGGGTLASTQVGIHSFAVGQAKVSTDIGDEGWGSIASGATETEDVTVSGATLGDFTLASYSISLEGLQLTSYVSAADTVTVVLSNLTGSAVDLGAGTLSILVLKSA